MHLLIMPAPEPQRLSRERERGATVTAAHGASAVTSSVPRWDFYGLTWISRTISGMPAEKVRLRIGNLAKAVLVSGQAYQDPKDALNEFVSNAADEYAEADRTGERIRVLLRRRVATRWWPSMTWAGGWRRIG